jgi:predicted nicotinamide N-methyase
MSHHDAISIQDDAEVTHVVVHGRTYRLLVPRRLEPFLDPQDELQRFPLWAKLWPASVVLAEWVARRRPDADKTMLEIGAGLGLTSIVAAACGHRIILSEINPDALRFARASAALNRCPDFNAIALDWNHPEAVGRFDCVIGSEVAYRPADIPVLLKLFQTCLTPGGEIVLAGEVRRTTEAFFRQMAEFFDIRAQRKVLRSDETSISIVLFRMRPRRDIQSTP